MNSAAGISLYGSLKEDFIKSSEWITQAFPAKPKNLFLFLRQINKISVHQDDKKAAYVKTVHDNRLGFYTDEQEADQYATEILSRIGVNPKSIVQLHLSEGLRRQKKFGDADWLRYHQMDMNECRSLYERNWREQNGNYFFVPIGELSVPHRGNCYRAFDTDREIQAHRLAYDELLANAPPRPEFEESWEHFVSEAKTLTNQRP